MVFSTCCSTDTKVSLQAVKAELADSKTANASLRAELNEIKKDRDLSARAVKSAEHSVSAVDARMQHLNDEVCDVAWYRGVPKF